MSVAALASYDARSLWQHHRPQFIQSIHGQSPEKVQNYIEDCTRSLISQGVAWEIVGQLRNWMQLCAPTPLQPRKLDFPVEERKTPPGTPEPVGIENLTMGSSNLMSSLVRVEFTAADWERAKAKIISYNKQLDKQRQKSAMFGRPGSLVTTPTPHIRYRELGPIDGQ